MSTITQPKETNDQYHADTTRISNSMLSVLKKSPQEFEARYVTKTLPHPQSTEAMALGHVVHCLALEPMEYRERFAVKPEGIDRRTTVGKAAWAALVAESIGKTIITQDDANTASQCVRRLVKHDQIGGLFARKGIVEQRINFVCNEVEMRCKPDLVLLDLKLIIDVKTTSDASPTGFSKSIASFGYARQAALYRDAVAIEHGIECRFLFAVVCTAAPYEVACYELTDEAMRMGGDEAELLLDEFKTRCHTNNWLPVWSSGVVPISLPRWYKNENYELELEGVMQ